MPSLSWILIFLIIFAVGFSQPAKAETMLSPSYQIRFGNFNMTSGLKSSTSYSLTDTVGQTAAGLFSSAGYSVKAGFQYIYTLYDFSFTISDLSIDLGTLSPTALSTDTNILTVTAPGQGYSVAAYETHRLQKGTSDFIPDTSCNSGCNEGSAGVWTLPSSHGFGYNLYGDDVSPDFTNNTYFRPFPDLSLGDLPSPIMTTNKAGKARTATVTYQASVAGSQTAGTYTTEIVYIATPNY